MFTTIPLSEARQTLPALIKKLHRLMSRVIITRNGKPQAVMLDIEEYESWVETLELLSSMESRKGIRQGLADMKKGRAKAFEEVFGEPLRVRGKKR